MSANTKTALILTMIWAIIKMVLFMTHESELGVTVGRLSMFLFIIIAVSLALWRKYKTTVKADTSTLSDLADAAKAGFIYVVFAIIFMFVYYQFIDPNFLPYRADQLIKEKTEWISIDENYNKTVEQSNLGDAMPSREDLIKGEAEQINSFHSKKMIIGVGFTIWIFVTMFTSLIVTILFRLVLLK